MKIRIVKKYARARHTYGRSKQGIAMEMKELMGYPWLMKHTSLRFWTKHWHRTQKTFRKHTGFSKRDYYDFFFCISREEGKEIIRLRKERDIEYDRNRQQEDVGVAAQAQRSRVDKYPD